MKTNLIKGTGVQGMSVVLNVCDMFAANQVANELEEVLKNHEEEKLYLKTPYDQRESKFPNGRPEHFELRDETLKMLHTLLCKMSYSVTSTIFSEEDE